MSKTILECEIEVYQSLKDGNRYIAMIEGFDWVFRGRTPMQAHSYADKWRKDRWNEIAKPDERVGPAKTRKARALKPKDLIPKTKNEEIEP